MRAQSLTPSRFEFLARLRDVVSRAREMHTAYVSFADRMELQHIDRTLTHCEDDLSDLIDDITAARIERALRMRHDAAPKPDTPGGWNRGRFRYVPKETHALSNPRDRVTLDPVCSSTDVPVGVQHR
jgi:hypothetical protein